MNERLHVLGAGAILPRAGFGPAGYALAGGDLDGVTLLDCGPGTVRALGAADLELSRVRRVILSHFHLDHCLDVFALAFARHNPRFAPAPELELLGPAGLARWRADTARALGPWAADPACTAIEVALDGDGLGRASTGPLALSCRGTGHTPEALAWRVRLPGGFELVYSGDSGPSDELVRLARGADLFLCECSFPDGAGSDHHLTPEGAGRAAARAGVARLVLTHFYPETDPEEARRGAALHYDGPIELARDGSVHALSPEPARRGR